MDLKPTMLQDRIVTLDILRGFSLLGILLVNMFAFYSPLPYIDLPSWFTSPSDIVWQQNLDIYVQSSFYPLFAMLFGYGLAIQWRKAEQQEVSFYSTGIRRLVVLFMFGLVHAILIWWGDILMTYAFCGLFLLTLLRFKPLTLLVVAIALNGVMQMMMLAVFSMAGAVDVPFVDITAIDNAVRAYGTGSWADAFGQRMSDLSLQASPLMWIMALFSILPYMLVGAAAAKWQLIERAKDFKRIWVTLTVLGLSVGIVVKSLPIMQTRTYLLDYLKVYVGGPILSVGYIALIVLLCLLPIVPKLLRPIAEVGRMSMTMYIMQSAIGTLLFYQFGLGWYGKVSVATGVLIAASIFIIQILLAKMWLSKYKQGPLEAIWRKLTYKKMLSEK
ncbi:MAG: DUF418 domain-containing protein [Lysinibacillus sp.]